VGLVAEPAEIRPVRVRAPAKVNLHLGVAPLEPTVYHELRTVFQALDLKDEIMPVRPTPCH